jgi:UDP-N-acetyl-D-glucosamine dehydrogenase
VNIALVNELAQLCDRMGIDVWEVVDAAGTKPFGFMRFEPGPGMGGHCLPVDPFYLAFKAREHDFYTEFIELAGKLNQSQPLFCVQKIEHTLNRASKPVRGSRILLLGVAYKGGVGDLREAPALKIIRRLRELGADIAYHDEHVPELPEFSLASADLDAELGSADIVCVVTAHPGKDYERVVREARLVLDFRGVTRGMEAANLVRL